MDQTTTTTVTLPRLLTVAEVAEYLNVKQSTLNGWRQEGRGPRSIKLEGCVRYSARDVLAWVEAQGAQR